MSKKIYGSAPVSIHQQALVAKVWELLPEPSGIPVQGLPRVEDLNFFECSRDFMTNRVRSVRKVQELISCVCRGEPGPKVSKRYNEGFGLMTPDQLESLNQFLTNYLNGLESSTKSGSPNLNSYQAATNAVPLKNP
jgi:hypothetical protein